MNKVLLFSALIVNAFCQFNQTVNTTPVLQPDSLPFKINIVLSDFQLPSDNLEGIGLQSFVSASCEGKWLLLAGRTNGLHGFDTVGANFPPRRQNTLIYVIDPNKKSVITRSLTDSGSGLTQDQIDTLSVTAAEYYQIGNTLYMVGGYGVESATGVFSTKLTLTAIDIPGLIAWVENSNSKKTAKQSIRQTSHPLLQVTGGYLTQANPHEPFLLIFGQNFIGAYTPDSNGLYTEQVRPFNIIDNGKTLYVLPLAQFDQNPNYRRRDLNVIPIVQQGSRSLDFGYVALSGVFTIAGGVWTVPVWIDVKGESYMPDPTNPNTFAQGMNNYISARAELFSKATNEMYCILMGGISYYTYANGIFTPDAIIPFTNNVTTLKIDSSGNFSQYIMENEYPFIPAQFTNPGNELLFGASARFIPTNNLSAFSNGVFSLDELASEPVLLGYIVGGIQSTLPNTADSLGETAASPYIFSVFLERR